ncbi:MAG: gliding motility protein [Deltaproteobacteria bacterium]|nr:gliding motility protein [Deltaproteobacteria bacterium]
MKDPEGVLGTHRVVACVGSGGVGKTTLAAALALGAARRGQRALVLTIDPARRLADAMGVELGSEPTRLSAPVLRELGVRDGSLAAMMLDTKRTFDELVMRFARDDATRDRIFANPIYQHVSDALAGSSEYSAMEKVDELVSGGEYDVVVLDTPPSQHALDFLEAPERLVGLIDSRIARHLLHPAMSAGRVGLRLFQRGTQPLFRVLEKISGMGFLEDLSEFLLLFEEMSEGFRGRADHVRELLFGGATAFVVASGPGAGQVDQALAMAQRLGDMGASVEGLILNRMRRWPDGADGSSVASARPGEWVGLAEALAAGGLGEADARRATDGARRCAESYLLQVKRDAETTAPIVRLARTLDGFVRTVPELPRDVHDLVALGQIEAQLFRPEGSGDAPAGAGDRT